MWLSCEVASTLLFSIFAFADKCYWLSTARIILFDTEDSSYTVGQQLNTH